jgi:soluble lytic murein transglycosylase
MLSDLAQRLHSTEALEAIAAIAQREADARALVSIGKAALQRGFPLDMAAYPINGIPQFDVLGDPMERAIVHAIARQESAFDPTAMSHAGARGLMQMMPATARETARRASLPFDWQKLGQDPLYAARMGAAHLNDLLKEWRGSYILTFAAYNAGSPNVKKWIAAYGDPRDPEVDAVDWVERIPFSETRNYVQRVMENLQVYRERLNQRTAYLIDYDLKRGGKRD